MRQVLFRGDYDGQALAHRADIGMYGMTTARVPDDHGTGYRLRASRREGILLRYVDSLRHLYVLFYTTIV
jgi:hypothetical protein